MGYAAEAAFMRGALTYGERVLARETLAEGGEVAGGKAGLYGGSLKASSCKVKKLISFLKDPAHRKKAAAWAQVLDPSGIEDFLLHKVTPVLLGNDTLVRNHGYEKGKRKATSYDSVLEAGMAVLVDIHGVPAVKCNCGNPLTTTETGIDVKIKIKFKGKKWGFDKKRMVKVKKSERPSEALVLANVDDQGQDIKRPVGANGAQEDEVVPPSDEVVTVPDLVGKPEDEARALLQELGLEAVSEFDPESDQEQGTVTSTEPGASSTVAPGSTVTLKIAGPETTTPTGAPSSTSDSSPDISPSFSDDGGGGTLNPTPGATDGTDLVGGTEGAT
ncbi:DUF6777 domain-containing protein [Streptomyces sp. NPDC001663]|uniref:DUF6777 domain-containing protein n=1 Tax=Streptomyces sp. NPDC001663 TaxID=3364597 RepID=UPI0036C8E194